MKKSALLLLPMLLHFFLTAQNISLSVPEKLIPKTNRFSVVGELNGQIYIHKYSPGNHYISIYDANLLLKNTKPVDLRRPSAVIKYVLMNASGPLAFYTDKTAKETVICARQLNASVELSGAEVILDSIPMSADQTADYWRLEISAARNYFLTYCPIRRSGVQREISLSIYRAGAQKAVHHRFETTADAKILNAGIDNEGNAIVLLQDKENEEAEETRIRILKLNSESVAESRDLLLGHALQSELLLDHNHRTGYWQLSGFYTREPRRENKPANGLFHLQLNAETLALLRSDSMSFDTDFIAALKGENKSANDNRLYTFRPRQMILQADGGCLFFAESYFRNTDDNPVPLSGLNGSSYSQVRLDNIYSFNDVMVVSIDSTGKRRWYEFLRKKQVSENDNGAYSSYFLLNNGLQLQLLYLDDINTHANLSCYTLGDQGLTERKLLANQDELDMMMVAKLGKQINPYEVVLPSYKKSLLRLIKLSF